MKKTKINNRLGHDIFYQVSNPICLIMPSFFLSFAEVLGSLLARPFYLKCTTS